VQPDLLYLGQKDFQQAAIIKRMGSPTGFILSSFLAVA
jgi:pantothenate synthetase